MSKEQEEPNPGHTFLFFAGVFGICVWLAMFAVAYSQRHEFDNIGQFGDAFGVANAFFAMFAMIGASFSGYLQYKTLHEQRRLIAEQQRSTQAEAAATIASSIAAWTTLTDRLKYTGELEIPHLRLAIEECKNRILLEVQMEALKAGEPPTMQYVETTQKWKSNQSTLRSTATIVSLIDMIRSDVYGFLIIDSAETRIESVRRNTSTWKSMAKLSRKELAVMMVERLAEIANDSNSRILENETKETIELLKVEVADKLGMYEV